MRKNVTGQLVSAQMISTTDGSDVTAGTCNVAVELDGAAGTGGTATHIANGKWEYAPIQADTNGDYVTFQFTLSGAVTQTVQIYTSFPQTGDTYGIATGAQGFAAIDTVVDSILADTGTDGVVVAAASKTGYTLTETTGLGNQTANITGSLSGSVGSVSADVNADVVKISTSATAADNLEASALGIITGTAAAGTLTTTTMTSTLTGTYADDELIGRVIVWTGGTAAGQAATVTDYANSGETFTYSTIITAPIAGDTFVVV